MIEIFWKEIKIITIKRSNKLYISNINYENFEKARKSGMPLIELIDFKLISKKLPNIIINRIPPKSVRDNILDNIVDDEGENILNYIKLTKCEIKTDDFYIYLT